MAIVQAVISAGGTGSRLKSEIGATPKILVQLGGISLLERHLANLEKWGFEKVLLLLGNGSEQILDFLDEIKHSYRLRVQYSVEGKPLGTGGSIYAAEPLLDESFLFFHGDLFINMPAKSLFRLWEDEVDFALFVHKTDHPEDSDLVETVGKNIQRFVTKPHSWAGSYRPYGNAGVYFFKKNLFEKKPDPKEKLDLDREIIPGFLDAGFKGVAVENRWEIRDIGTPIRLRNTELELQRGLIGLAKRPAILLDRDGTLNVADGYITSPSALRLIREAPQAIKRINDAGVLAIVVTNQPVIARGDITILDLEAIHFKLEYEISSQGGRINGFYICPHHPESGFKGEVAELKISCECRKPSPGMILKAIEDYGIDKMRCAFIGDSWRDEQSAQAAGIEFFMVEGTGFENNILECVDNALMHINGVFESFS
jgi:mannose-1-phosphate guanylyltransferase/phosphomannomutase